MRHLSATGSNLSKWAREHGRSYAEAKAWVRKNKPIRPPDYIADEIAFEFGLPADTRTWPQGIRITRIR
jgi:hypothetical protein